MRDSNLVVIELIHEKDRSVLSATDLKKK